MEKTCPVCHCLFNTQDKRKIFCGRKCWAISRTKPKINKVCKQCQKHFFSKEHDNKTHTYLFCSQKCYGQYRKENYSGKNHNSWKGGVTYANGYRYIYLPNHPYAEKKGYFMEHRKIMEDDLGRLLDPVNEVVHHKDGDILNNSIENLEVMSRAAHLLIHHFPNKSE